MSGRSDTSLQQGLTGLTVQVLVLRLTLRGDIKRLSLCSRAHSQTGTWAGHFHTAICKVPPPEMTNLCLSISLSPVRSGMHGSGRFQPAESYCKDDLDASHFSPGIVEHHHLRRVEKFLTMTSITTTVNENQDSIHTSDTASD